MKSIDRNKKLLIIAFILSLLFHASLMIYFLLQKTDNTPIIQTQTPEKKPEHTVQKNEPWAETKAHANNFGAPVFFKDKPSEQTTETPSQPETPTIDTSSIEHHIDIPESKDIIDQTPHQEKTIMRRTKRIGQPRQKREPIQQQLQQKTISQHILSKPKQLPTLAQLTQGFMNHVKDEGGQHLVSMLGPKKGLPSEDQIKYERYIQKISACITNSFAIHHTKFTLSSPVEDNTLVFIAINRNGTLYHIALRQSSGNKGLDAFVLSVFRDASLSFPPLPHYLPDNPLTLTCIVPTKTEERSSITIHVR